jgi:30S ribosomal protein S31
VFNFVQLYKTFIIMGKGDIKSKKGKIWRGSYGKRRPSKPKKAAAVKK